MTTCDGGQLGPDGQLVHLVNLLHFWAAAQSGNSSQVVKYHFWGAKGGTKMPHRMSNDFSCGWIATARFRVWTDAEGISNGNDVQSVDHGTVVE